MTTKVKKPAPAKKKPGKPSGPSDEAVAAGCQIVAHFRQRIGAIWDDVQTFRSAVEDPAHPLHGVFHQRSLCALCCELEHADQEISDLLPLVAIPQPDLQTGLNPFGTTSTKGA